MFTGDGRPDLAVFSRGVLVVHASSAQDATGTATRDVAAPAVSATSWASPRTTTDLPFDEATVVAVGDVNGDGVGDLRVDRVLELCQASGAAGVVHHTLRLCQLFDMEVPRLSAALKERGLPLLNLHAEYTTDGGAALKNRVDAFVEMLHL